MTGVGMHDDDKNLYYYFKPIISTQSSSSLKIVYDIVFVAPLLMCFKGVLISRIVMVVLVVVVIQHVCTHLFKRRNAHGQPRGVVRPDNAGHFCISFSTLVFYLSAPFQSVNCSHAGAMLSTVLQSPAAPALFGIIKMNDAVNHKSVNGN